MAGGSIGKSKSDSRSANNQNVWEPQGNALNQMYSQMGNLWGGSQGDVNALRQQANDLSPYMQNIMGGQQQGYTNLLGGGSYGDTSEIRSQLLDSIRNQEASGSQMGNMYNSIVGGEGNTYIDPMVDAMKSSSIDNLRRMQSGTDLDAASAGQSGSSRHAMQNAMQASEMNQDMLDREAMMRGSAYDKDLAMKMDIARMADTNTGAAQDRLLGMLSGADRNVSSGMQLGQGMQNLGMGALSPQMQAMSMPWQMMGSYANSLGSPTVLGSGSSSGNSKGFGAGATFL